MNQHNNLAKTAGSLIALIFLLTMANVCNASSNIGVSGGIGKPNSMKGYRISAATDLYQWPCVNLELETSFAKWMNNRDDINNLEVFSLGPMVRWNVYQGETINTFLQGSVAGAKKSSTVVGRSQSGSKWTFQDILGVGFKYRDRVAASISYLHYSNCSFADPNPGIDILPLLTITFML